MEKYWDKKNAWQNKVYDAFQACNSIEEANAIDLEICMWPETNALFRDMLERDIAIRNIRAYADIEGERFVNREFDDRVEKIEGLYKEEFWKTKHTDFKSASLVLERLEMLDYRIPKDVEYLEYLEKIFKEEKWK